MNLYNSGLFLVDQKGSNGNLTFQLGRSILKAKEIPTRLNKEHKTWQDD